MNPALSMTVKKREEIRTQLATYRRHQELIREGVITTASPIRFFKRMWLHGCSVAKDRVTGIESQRVVRLSAEGNPFGTHVKLKATGCGDVLDYLEETTKARYTVAWH
ncbi:MAG: hypothetical protein ACLUD0_12580 [Eubacterium ramulus]